MVGIVVVGLIGRVTTNEIANLEALNINVQGYILFETSTIHADGDYNSLRVCRISSEVIAIGCG